MIPMMFQREQKPNESRFGANECSYRVWELKDGKWVEITLPSMQGWCDDPVAVQLATAASKYPAKVIYMLRTRQPFQYKQWLFWDGAMPYGGPWGF